VQRLSIIFPVICEKSFRAFRVFPAETSYYVKKFDDFFSTFSEPEIIVPRVGAPIAHLFGGQIPWSHIKIL